MLSNEENEYAQKLWDLTASTRENLCRESFVMRSDEEIQEAISRHCETSKKQVEEIETNHFDKEVDAFCEKWNTSKEAVLELIESVGRQNGIRAVCAELPA